ncbi:MAG: 2,3-bisphosphoglycerate-dependent phosphoglycerate mutase [Crocinitomicaceae bacterium]|nr:2,3-bisphosphoglycerate-dependent phosphoglycerate mutase [Crocinitomicaceae bacterium]|tara:strand:- start:23402 stop:24007 length:606 start_codon:yes stop_codon:yes gene_type:complete
MPTLVLVRHGQSQWNLENKFTGWVDVDLTEKGESEAKSAGEKLEGFHFENAFTSVLKRANRTLDIILEETSQRGIPVLKDKALNERMYGDLQGMDKDEAREKFGEDQVHIWRRSYDVPPPGGESLKDTRERVLPFYKEHIEPMIKAGKNVLVVAHGNSLRSLVMFLEDLSPEEILKREIPTGSPYVYDLDDNINVITAEFI